MTPSAITGYARFNPRRARQVLAAIVVLTCILVAISLSPLAKSQVDKAPHGNDAAYYAAVVERMQSGEGYYGAMQAELVERGYPTRSVFNWRLPPLFWLLGELPHLLTGKILLCMLAAAALLLSYQAMGKTHEGFVIPLLFAVLMTGPLLPCMLGCLFVAPVLWAGVLIALSVAAYGLGRRGWAVAFGIAALVCRELALPYVVVMGVMAWRGGQRREAAGWAAGLLGWFGLLAWHAAQVHAMLGADAIAQRQGWIQFGGAAFVLSMAQMNAYLLMLPQWVTALYVAAALVGLAGWQCDWGRRLALVVSLFMVAFGVVGQDFNQYWGFLIAPLWCYGVARFPASIADLCRAAKPRSTAIQAASSTMPA